MPTLAESPRLRLFTLCALYVAQGIPWGFVVITLAAWLGERGLGTDEIGSLMALSTLPWSFKWLLGPVIDGVRLPGGRRRPYIVLAQGMMVATIAAMLAIPDLTQSTQALAVAIFVHNCFGAMQDVAVDALAVDLLHEDERGRANGLMYGSKYLGGAIGGAGLAHVIAAHGMRSALLVQTALLCAIGLLPLLLREGERVGRAVEASEKRILELFVDLRRAFSLRATAVGALLALAVQIAVGILSPVEAVFFTQKLGWTSEDYTSVTGGWAIACGLAGSIGGGWLADRLGHKRLVVTAGLLLATCWAVFGNVPALWPMRPVVTVLLLAQSFLQALVSVGLFALFMDISWPRVAATQFTAYMALLNLSATLGHKLAGPLDAWLDFGGLYALAAAVQIMALVLILPIDPHQTRATLGEG